ncbi:elongation of very long chain fatty acids protein AAEL008004-like isoform X1 [Cimex lectularius]|uniref:Elongation of very long chain fatty acids protein n=2 Tax=Cimex lectularius TaxID=79782 RepID=A0A8I6TL32_CIMLE|nr:elongation of very long chain fatty acids protein AAEL008004-like isoform X1 [Cimex lectularius]
MDEPKEKIRMEFERLPDLTNNSTMSTGEVDNWFMMESPFPVLTLTSVYLYFVLWLGPAMMSKKQPLSLQPLIVLYNAAQVAFSSWWVYKVAGIFSVLKASEVINAACRPSLLPSAIANQFDVMGWWYLMSKFVELLDTIFFVLRRKQNQVTFLHVYHHTNMAVSTWAFIKYVKGSQTMMIGFCNTLVHVVMYAYYLLSALGPKIQKYLWWKRYITRLQIVQFLIIISYLVSVMIAPCQVPSAFITFAVGNTASFLLLFYNFYIRAYPKKAPAKGE